MTKKYRVLGEFAFRGYKPGDEFEDDVPESEEQWALDNGRVEIVDEQQQEVEHDA
jgi:hypothetical protein